MIPVALDELGKKFVALGRAMQDHDTTLTELCGLAFDCGLRMDFRIVPREAEQAPTSASPSQEGHEHD